MENKTIIFIPSYLNINILKKTNNYKYIYIYNYYYIFINSPIFFFNHLLSYIIILITSNIYLFLKIFFFSWELFFTTKYIVLGKGFKLKKYKQISFWKYNKAHFKYLFLFKYILQKKKKNCFFFISKHLKLKHLLNFINNIYKRNIFLKKNIKNLNTALILKKKKS